MTFEDRLTRLEREFNHLVNVMGTQRESVSKALQGVQTTMLEQELMLRTHLGGMLEALKELAQRQAEQEEWRSTIEERVSRLEKRPPAA